MLNTYSQNHRPYFNYKYEQLFEIAKDNWNDLSGLQTLKEELNHRNTPWTRDLKNQVNEQLEALESEVRMRIPKDKRKFKNSESFPWVSTKVGFGFEKMDTGGLKKSNLLSLREYRTGNYSDLSAKARRTILYKTYEEDIPKRIAALVEDIEDWGNPKSGMRLRKIAESLAFVVRSEKMHQYDYEKSISERESDLADLKRKYYDGIYDK